MRLVHNYYVDFLKSLKKFISNIYGDATVEMVNGIETVGGIKYFEFNYASKSLLHYKLYQHINFEYPTCIINIIDVQTDNSHPMRYNSGIYTPEIAQIVGTNTKTMDNIVVDYRWVTINLNIRMNFETGADVINYYDRLNNLPVNFMFYSYKYSSFIDGTDLMFGSADDYEGVYLKMEPTTGRLRYWFNYMTEPIFKIVSKQKNIMSDTNDFYIDLSLEVQLKIPAIIAGVTYQNQVVKNIEIIIANTFNIDNPLLIDTKEVYIDNKNKLNHVILLNKEDFSIESIDATKGTNRVKLKISTDFLPYLENKIISLYICSDVTDRAPQISHKEFGVFNIDETNILIEDDSIVFIGSSAIKDDFYTGYLSLGPLSDIRLLVFNI